MAYISKITLPNGSSYNIKDIIARSETPSSASISNGGTITFRNADGFLLFSVQLPLYTGGNS